mmetsp:Transcript_279/g.580  ORF Transcript_279/g.580 Transcript_279/m.580 type:complete len:261 (+) Transcript_279:1318-2100(+)
MVLSLRSFLNFLRPIFFSCSSETLTLVPSSQLFDISMRLVATRDGRSYETSDLVFSASREPVIPALPLESLLLALLSKPILPSDVVRFRSAASKTSSIPSSTGSSNPRCVSSGASKAVVISSSVSLNSTSTLTGEDFASTKGAGGAGRRPERCFKGAVGLTNDSVALVDDFRTEGCSAARSVVSGAETSSVMSCNSDASTSCEALSIIALSIVSASTSSSGFASLSLGCIGRDVASILLLTLFRIMARSAVVVSSLANRT